MDDQSSSLRTYAPKHKIRMITATSIFDGHDASINIMRRLLQARGAEVIHLGHNRTAHEIVSAALQEDVQGIALSSYQGGHMEFFTYVRKLLDEEGGQDIKIFGGGGGVITPAEISELEKKGIEKIYSPEDGQRLGLDGIIGDILKKCDFSFTKRQEHQTSSTSKIARSLTLLENAYVSLDNLLQEAPAAKMVTSPILGITGTGGAGKSSLVDEILLRFLQDFPEMRIALICVDPSKKKTGGALLGDRIRINACANERIFLRSLASRGSGRELAKISGEAAQYLKSQGFHLVIVETSGIGQGDTGILDVCDTSLYVMTPEYGASTQLEKIDMLDFADFIAVNKYERRQGPDAVRDIKATIRRNRFKGVPPKDDQYPVYGTIASRFNDDGVNGLYKDLVRGLAKKYSFFERELSQHREYAKESTRRNALVPAQKEHYLAEIANSIKTYHKTKNSQVSLVRDYESLSHAHDLLKSKSNDLSLLEHAKEEAWEKILPELRDELSQWPLKVKAYQEDTYTYQVRGKDVKVEASFTTVSRKTYPRVALPRYESKAEIARFFFEENLPGSFPYTGGIFPFRRKGEDPKRQFAGEGGPLRTNKRFHYLCKGEPAKRLSTAFDSATLYGSSPEERPDIYGKIGESGVSIAHLDDMKDLYRGFDLCDPSTSVSMTINGPAPIILAMFLNTAIDQQVKLWTDKHSQNPSPQEFQKIYDETLNVVRGTVQADILKEDQGQNTCIFSIEFALKLMGDVQEYFIEKKVRNYYAVSISGYHIAEAGANPISQLAFTLANGFTFVEYYLARGMNINDFAPNLSFFFSNGIDTEYAVLGRVARRIWAIAMRDVYGADERAQKLKYHVQTSGRSLHAQEMTFNDIRTTLQALMALYDNCNSLHTNAFDEALTTPTEASVRQAMAIQLIINQEFGLNKCENVNQGSFFIEALTDLVEEAVLEEFERISARGGVLGAMETQYQRSQIQEESLYYERMKDSGELPLIGVNTFLNPKAQDLHLDRDATELIRASYDEKNDQLKRKEAFQKQHADTRTQALESLKKAVLENRNIFAELMLTVRHATLGEITQTLYEVGGQYRRAM